MDSFEKIFKDAQESISDDTFSSESLAMNAIALSILALALAIKESDGKKLKE